ncbi:E3 ubiquitin-protein ligase RNF8-like isoform X1 [Aphis gossypii]|uniref:E3 ubiquitin-protein ligase RNF8-like isoform X1 n=1 Tax=Aphis gossypii TaxID=80765 RepID=UPI0021596498|nr:E3 ubiquitin-protein ligase RNF8-like isoform X1 [Aphis gossypii]
MKDIKNVMSSKRLNSDSNTPQAFVQDLKTGKLSEVKIDSNFLFGRAKQSSIVIEELYISRSHSTISYANGQFFLEDNNSFTGTYLNYKKISNVKVQLQNGDLIAYTDRSNTWEYLYKFCLSNSKKKPRLDEENAALKDNKLLKLKINKLQALINELKQENKESIHNARFAMSNVKKLINKSTELNKNLKDKTIELQIQNRELIKKLNISSEQCEKLKESLDTKTAQDEEPIEIFKTQINRLLENDFQCSICNEVMLRASTANCNHTFCESCLNKWLSKSKLCPVCRSIVHNTTYCLALDNYITNLCDILGGTIKEQRTALQRERSGPPPQVAKRGRRRANPSIRNRRETTYDITNSGDLLSTRDNAASLAFRRNNAMFLAYNLQPVLDIVDLTNNTSR